MKKIISLFLAVIVLLALAGCGNETVSSQSGSSNIVSNEVESEKEDKISTADLYGYSYAFDFSYEDKGLSSGFVARGKNYNIAIMRQGSTFNSWDTAIEDNKIDLFALVYKAVGLSVWNMEDIKSELITNPQGIEILKVDLALIGQQNEKIPTLCYYFVNDRNEIVGFVSIIEEGFEDEIKASMDYMAENLKKAE